MSGKQDSTTALLDPSDDRVTAYLPEDYPIILPVWQAPPSLINAVSDLPSL